MQNYDAIIIGAGIVGCSIAFSLNRAGVQTLNVDRLPAPGYGSTSHSSAIIRPFYSHVTACAVAHEARHRWLHWGEFLQAQAGEILANYQETGGVVLVRSGQEADYADNLAALDAVGIEHSWLDKAALQQRFPGMSLATFGPPKRLDDPQFGLPTGGEISGGIYIPACGHVNDPQLAAQNLYHAAQRVGGQFRFDTQIGAYASNPNGVHTLVTDSGEKLHAAVVINAAGPHSSVINEMMGIAEGLPIKTQALRHEVAYVQRPSRQSAHSAGFLVDLDSGFYQRQDGADLLIGTTDPACDPAPVVDPDQYNSTFTDQWTLQVYRAAQRFPELAIESKARGTVGLYDTSDDWIPIYDKTQLPGYYLAIGTSGNQFKNAPLIGDMLATLVLAGSRGIDHDQLPQSLMLEAVNRRVDLAFYSRNRPVQATSSVLA